MEKYLKGSDFFTDIGDSGIKKIQEKLEALGAYISVIIHPDSVIGGKVRLVAGTVVILAEQCDKHDIFGIQMAKFGYKVVIIFIQGIQRFLEWM